MAIATEREDGQMSSIGPITPIPAIINGELDGHLFILLHLDALDGAHAMKHKAEGNMDSCQVCRDLLMCMRLTAEGKETALLAAVEGLAVRLFWNDVRQSFTPEHAETLFRTELTREGRDMFRRRALEMLDIVQKTVQLDVRLYLTKEDVR